MNFQLETPTRSGFSTYRKLDPKACANSKTQAGMILSDPTSDSSIFQDTLPEIENLEDLLKWLTGLLIHFDTAPQNYQKSDYKVLISIVVKSLIHLYKESAFYVLDSDFKQKLNEIDAKFADELKRIEDLEDKVGEGLGDAVQKINATEQGLNELKNKYKDLEDSLPSIIINSLQQLISTPKSISVEALDLDNVEVRFDCGSSTKLIQN